MNLRDLWHFTHVDTLSDFEPDPSDAMPTAKRELPWSFEPSPRPGDGFAAGEVTDAEGYTVARVDGYPEDGLLMAAAPEMLDALYSMLNIEGAALKGAELCPALKGLDVPYHFAKVRAAIAKAEGK